MARRGRAYDVIEVSDSDSDDRRTAPPSRRARADPSTHMRRPTEWAFLESPSGDEADDSDDFERPTPTRSRKPSPKKPEAKAKSPKRTPPRPKAKKPKAKARRRSDEYSDEDEVEEIDERPRRVAVRHLFSDHLTVSELQAQEREMARLRALHAASGDTRKTTASPNHTNGKVGKSSPAPKSPAKKPAVSSHRSAPSPVTSVAIGRTVLATTLARKQQQQSDRIPSTPPKNKHKASKRQRDESEEELDEDSDDFLVDIVEAKRAALRESLELAKMKGKPLRVGIKTVVDTPSPSPSPPSSPPRRSFNGKFAKKEKKKAVSPPPPTKSRAVTPTPQPKSKKSKHPAKKKPKIDLPPIVEPRESRRKTGQGLLSDWLSVSELQAQEREWSRLQRDLKASDLASPSPQAKETKHKESKSKDTSRPAHRDRSSRSSRRLRADSASSSDVSLVEIVELIEDDDEDDAKDDADFVIAPPAPSKKSKTKKPTQSKKRPSAPPKSSTPAVPRPPAHASSGTATNSKRADIFTKPRTAAETVPHWTMWRAVSFTSAPQNLLPLPTSMLPPFESAADRPLIDYDTKDDLESKCRILPSFGKTKSFLLTNDPSKPEVTQDSMNERVMELLEHWTPHIKSCYARKCDAIVHEARVKTNEYVRLRDERIQDIVRCIAHSQSEFQLQAKKLPVCAAERELAKQLSLTKEVSPLDIKSAFTVGRGDAFLVEKKIVPHVAIEHMEVRQISRSTTYVGIKSSVRVEDDPILRYVPYFGDNDNGDAIDMKAYDAVRAKEAVEGAKSANGLDNEAHEYMLRLVIAEYGDLETVFNALKQVAGFAQPYTEYCEIKKRLDSRQAASKRMQEIRDYIAKNETVDEDADDESTRTALIELTKGLYPFADPSRPGVPLDERLASHWTYFDTNLLPSNSRPSRGFRRLLGLRNTTDYADVSETYRDLFCRMCYKYDCPEHGIEHPMPTRRVDPLYPTTRYAPLVTKEETNKQSADHEAKTATREEDNAEAEDGHQKPSGADVVELVSGDDENTVETTQVTDVTDIASECSASTAESQETIDLSALEPRRSSRSGTRASTLASISVEAQLTAQGFKTRNQRSRAKAAPKRANGDESEYLDDSHRALISSKVKTFLKASETCSESCWKGEGENEEAKSTGGDDFTEPEEEIKSRLNAAELLVLQKLRYTVGDNACMIASVLQSLSCRDVHTYLVSQQRSKPTDQQGYFSPDVSGKKNRKRGRATAALPGNNRELLKRTRHQRLKDTASANHDYEPCNHEGICDFGASCSCMKRDHMCEKACSCSRDCPNRFQGCKCSMGNCRTNQCPCFVAMRECNPDLCHSCGASDVPVLIYNPEFSSMSSQELGICCNVNVQRGLHKKIGVSYSRTHGWGSFALEPIKKGEFIYEYTGAIISHDEAERRGSIYDKLNISFLFDLNEDSVADAVRTGNKSKFCNHANVGQKCHARIFRISGEHHISIWALQDIRAGEELFFNYGYHGESAPVWSQGARITETSKREADEAAMSEPEIQALDD